MRNYIFENHRIVNDVEQAVASQACHFASNERGLITIDELKMSQLPSDTKHDVSCFDG